ncbi:phosphatidylglycerophosphatase A family protein [Aquifex pyrophilus]
MSHLLEFIATGFYVGKFPLAPGTLGTLVGIPIVLLLYLDKKLYLLGTLVLFLLGWISSEYMVNAKREEDPEEVVIDEIVGYLLCFLFVEPTTKTLITAFIVFRVIDIYKPFPVNLFENFPGGLGVMMDDVVGGIITAFVLYLLLQ